MSANNWTQCPRCLKRRAIEIENKETQIAASYGNVSIEEFDAQRADLAYLKDTSPDNTFREDYEITGASEGFVEVVYSGACGTCNLRANFRHSHVFDLDGAS